MEEFTNVGYPVNIKKAARLPNGLVFIRSIYWGSRVHEYKTKFAYDRAIEKCQRYRRAATASYWLCENCGHTVYSSKWAAKHRCK
jgi:hypothetical protein